MALINCPECGQEVSDRAKACPKCAFPLQEDQTENHAPRTLGDYGAGGAVNCNSSGHIQTIEQTSKEWKKWELIGVLLLILGLMFLPFFPFSLVLFIIVCGLVAWSSARIMAWWHHG